MAQIKTAEQYLARYRKRGLAKAPKQNLHKGHPTTFDMLLSPNHAARFASISNAHAGMYRPQKSPDFVKIPLEGGNFKGCAHSLSVWYEDRDDKNRVVYFQRAAPCTVDHGYKRNKHGNVCVDMGKAGEHLDSHGRKW
jgi:hypothetical protein